MPRMRTLKPSFFTNDTLASLPPVARLLFAGLWCIADREGRLEDRPQRIKVEVLPYDKANVDRLLDELRVLGFIQRYEADGRRFIQVVNFERHQSPHVKEPASTIPAPYSHRASTGDSGTSTPDPDLGSDLGSDPLTGTVTRAPAGGIDWPKLTDLQERLLQVLHARVRDQVMGGVDAPDTNWCEDLIRRGAKARDVDYAIQETVGRKIRGRGAFKYVRECLETRVKEREAGNDPDAVPEREAGAPSGGRYASGSQQRRLARERPITGTSADEFDDLPPHALRPDAPSRNDVREPEGGPGEGTITRFPVRDRAGGGAA